MTGLGRENIQEYDVHIKKLNVNKPFFVTDWLVSGQHI